MARLMEGLSSIGKEGENDEDLEDLEDEDYLFSSLYIINIFFE